MIDLTPGELATVQAILRVHVPDVSVCAFGSRVTGRRRPHSDLDLVLISEAPIALATLALLEDALAESDLPFRVDVVDWERATPQFREIMARACEPIEGVPPPRRDEVVFTVPRR